MDPSGELLGRVREYVDDQLSHGELAEWLLEYADHFLAVPEDAFEARLWSRTLNLLCLLNDKAIAETLVRQEIESLLATRQAIAESV